MTCTKTLFQQAKDALEYVRNQATAVDAFVGSNWTGYHYDTVAGANLAATNGTAPVGQEVTIRGRDASGDGGRFDGVVEGISNDGYPAEGRIRPSTMPVNPLMWGASGAAIAAAVTFGPTTLPYDRMIADAPIVVTKPHNLAGHGWYREPLNAGYVGSVIEGDASVTDLLTLQSEDPDQRSDTLIQGIAARDFALIHRGSGTGLTVDNIARPYLENIAVDCDGVGAVAVRFGNSSFFATTINLLCRRFTEVGVLIEGDGSERTFINNHVVSNEDTAQYGFDIRVQGVTFLGGQVNISTGGTFQDPAEGAAVGGWAYRFWNPDPDVKAGRSVVKDVLAESGNFVIIDAVDGGRYDNVEIVGARINHSNANVSPVIHFGNTKGSVLRNPDIKSTQEDSPLLYLGAGSIDCGFEGSSSDAAKIVISSHQDATRPYVRITGRTEFADVLPQGANNITYHYDHVEGLGPVTRSLSSLGRGAWDRYQWLIADNDRVAFPWLDDGRYSFWCDDDPSVWVDFVIKTGAVHEIERVATGSNALTVLSSGTLDGTTGVDGDVSYRYNRANTSMQIENRSGQELLIKMRKL